MIRNYFVSALRNIVKNGFFSTLNIFGLALGMAACFFIFQYVHFESGYDHSFKNLPSLYRVTSSFGGSLASTGDGASNHPGVGPTMKKEFPEVLDFTRLVEVSLFTNSSTFSYTPANGVPVVFNEDKIYITDGSFFHLFNQPFVYGDSTALYGANAVVITQTIARKYFGNTNPLGQTIFFSGDQPLKVTGVIRDWPEDSHLRINMLISFETLAHNWGYDAWDYPEFYNYVLLAPGADPRKLEAQFPAFIEKHMRALMDKFQFNCQFHLQPVGDIHLRSKLVKEAEVNGSQKEISFLTIIGVFILIIAWINYINLSTAKSMERAREVGLRKVVGAGKSQLIAQFQIESFIVNFIALLVAFCMILLSASYLEHLTGKKINDGFFTGGLGTEPLFWITALGIFIAGAFLVGAYPAIVLSSFRPAVVFRGIFNSSSRGISIRKILVSFQFVLSIILIAGTLIVYLQLQYMQNSDPGYKKEQVLIIKAPSVGDSTMFSKLAYFKTEAVKNPAVLNISGATDIPGDFIRYRNSVRRNNQDQKSAITSSLIEIDEGYVPTYDIPLIAGRNFYKDEDKDSRQINKVLINEELAHTLGYADTKDAVNQNLLFNLGENEWKVQVVGVLKSYHQRSFREKFEPILYYQPWWKNWKYYSVKINAKDATTNIAALEKLYKTIFPGNPFDFHFLDEAYNNQYLADRRLGKVFGLFTILAVIVACMGLIGLSSYVIKLRTKEIGIRKVLGASVTSILALFTKDFLRLVVIASLIAVPLIFLAASKWLENFAFHIELSWLIFVIPPLVLLLITLVTICLQSIKSALSNPVSSLRAE